MPISRTNPHIIVSKHQFTAAQRYAIWKTHHQRCYWCCEPLRLQETTIDHLIPESFIGQTDEFSDACRQYGLSENFGINGFENWLPCHHHCNTRKGASLPPLTPEICATFRMLWEKRNDVSAVETRVKTDKGKDKLLGRVLVALEGDTLTWEDIASLFPRGYPQDDDDMQTLEIEVALGPFQRLIKSIERTLLAIPPRLEESLSAFSNRLDRGVLKLLPRGKYDTSLLLRGGGAYYSFTKRNHEYGYGSDIELAGGGLSTGFAGADFGFFLELGEIPVQAILEISEYPPIWLDKEKYPAWRHMWEYSVPSELIAVRMEQRLFNRGTEIGGVTIARNVRVVSGCAYLLRSINFGKSDVLVALQVQQVCSDGSVFVSWTVLQAFPVPNFTGPDIQRP